MRPPRPALLLIGLLLATASAQAQDGRPSVEALAARVAEAPDDEAGRRALAARYTEAGDPGKAVPHLAWLAEHAPTDTDLLWTYARHLMWTERGGEAVPVLDRIVALDADDAEARVVLAEAVMWDGGPQTGGAGRAVALVAPLAAARPGDARVQRVYAFALHASGDEAAARAQYTRALALDPDHAAMLLESGAIERWQGDWSLGERRLRRALALGLDAGGAARARDLLDGLRHEHAPTLVTGAERSTDSNAITRFAAPLRVAYTVNSTFGVGAVVAWDRLSSDQAGGPAPSAAATVVAPTLVYTPERGQRLATTLGAEAVPGGRAALRLDVDAQRAWTAPFFNVFAARFSVNTGRDGVETLDRRLGVARFAGTWYAEPRPGLGVGLEAAGLRYGDRNARVVLGASGRARVAEWGARGEGRRPALALALTAGAVYDDTRTLYPSSTPYYTPDDLTTTSGGVAVEASPWAGVDLDAGVGAAHQNGPFPSTSLEVHLRLGVDAGLHRLDVDLRRSGSDAYSVETVGLRYTTRFL